MKPLQTPVTGFPRSSHSAFTLIELMVVVMIIAILAALTLSTMGYVNKKGADSRARSEVAALSAAIDAYKLERGAYPASNNLYKELTGQGPLNTNRVFFEPIPQMLNTNANPITFIDPWGTTYNYATSSTYFDIWSTGGGLTNSNDWIRN